ncbi:uncharacterized protein BO87DRAFT_410233 [Aspergillus neoniger CBS 115656]|uniref:PRELI/MSF1 domain-containing protein n=1 Tax=Aspergillus neoniger (strain CBS 115656) TaxID=1448310 RepID=A0A318Y6B9_ASPNB|nr:hypothetical protein BO87DRAFT_410233 [Aspergillus neoniger CBS 115656]PYH29836.1 hypothetical protein BO87DRAFT_410233 [Aspergillus neoniger CBS 115656]
MASEVLPQDFKIISSLRYDPALSTIGKRAAARTTPDPLTTPYYLLPYHQERLRNAAACFSWGKALAFLKQDTNQFVEFLNTFIPDNTKPWRLRILLDSTGTCEVEVNPTTSMNPLNYLTPTETNLQSTAWRVYIDSERISPSVFTTHKTTARDFYTAARLRSGIVSFVEPAEVLLVNPAGAIMEGSITTPYFRRRNTTEGEGKPAWITPPLSSGGNAGTTRQYALAQGFCAEDTIAATDLVDGEECWLSNGVRGFIRGKIKTKRTTKYYMMIGQTGDNQMMHRPIPALPNRLSGERPEADRNSSHIPNATLWCDFLIPIIRFTLYASFAIMKFFENVFTYDYSFPAVSLAYFLRYPNPYSRHVLTTDVIDRYVDPTTQRLHTTRLLLKKSKVPSGILKLLPKGIGGSDNSGQSYILETTVVDAKEGWMQTESRNMEWTGILSVVEKQFYQRQPEGPLGTLEGLSLDDKKSEQTTVRTTVTFRSKFGQGKLLGRRKTEPSSDHTGDYEEEAPKRGLFTSLSTAGIQRTIELIGLNRTRDAVLKSKQGMNVVLERLRNGGIVGVLEGMRQDREAAFGPEGGPWKRVWLSGHGHASIQDDDN